MPAEFRQKRNRDGADAAGGAGDDGGAVRGFEPVPLQRHDGEHGGVTRRANSHGLRRAHAFGQRHKPLTLDARLLPIGPEMRLARAPAVEDHRVSRFDAVM